MAEIFISYSSHRRSVAGHLADVLKHHGFSLWFDYQLIKGSDFRTQIESRIRDAKAVVVLWCSMSARSRWVAEEADVASKCGTLIPVKIERCELPLGFKSQSNIDMTSWDAAPRGPQLDELIDALEQRIGRSANTDRNALRQYEEIWYRFGAPTIKLLLRPQRAAPWPAAVESGERYEPSKKANVVIKPSAMLRQPGFQFGLLYVRDGRDGPLLNKEIFFQSADNQEALSATIEHNSEHGILFKCFVDYSVHGFELARRALEQSGFREVRKGGDNRSRAWFLLSEYDTYTDFGDYKNNLSINEDIAGGAG